jgi:hypothetical protein
MGAFDGKAPEAPALPGEEEHLAGIIARPVATPSDEVIAAIDSGPFDFTEALPRAEASRLCDPEPMEVETGWTKLPDGSIQVAFRTELPDLTPEMVEWWFDWHPLRDDRYRAWHPQEHFGNRALPGAISQAKSYWGAVIFFDEDVGDGRTQLRTEFTSPLGFGIPGDPSASGDVAVIVSARVGDAYMTHTDMIHVFLRQGDGLVLRSRMWIAERVRLRLPGPLAALEDVGENLVSRKLVRDFAVPDGIGAAVARHGAEEHAQLNVILPGLHERFADA